MDTTKAWKNKVKAVWSGLKQKIYGIGRKFQIIKGVYYYPIVVWIGPFKSSSLITTIAVDSR